MLLAERGLVSDVKHRYGALLAVCKLGGTAGEELLRVVQQDVLGRSIKEILQYPTKSIPQQYLSKDPFRCINLTLITLNTARFLIYHFQRNIPAI